MGNRDNIFPQNTVCLGQRVTHTEVELKLKSNLPMALCNDEMYSELRGSVGTSPVCFVPQAISSQLWIPSSLAKAVKKLSKEDNLDDIN